MRSAICDCSTCKSLRVPPFTLLHVSNNSVYYSYIIITQWLVGWFWGQRKKGACVGKKVHCGPVQPLQQYIPYNTSPGNMHIPALCNVSYHIPDFGCCRLKFIFHGQNMCSVELPVGVFAMNNLILAKWRISIKHSHQSVWESLKYSSSSTIMLSSECNTQ